MYLHYTEKSELLQSDNAQALSSIQILIQLSLNQLFYVCKCPRIFIVQKLMTLKSKQMIYSSLRDFIIIQWIKNCRV